MVAGRRAPRSDAVLFIAGKVRFIRPDGTEGKSPGDGTTLFSAGAKGRAALVQAQASGLGRLMLPYHAKSRVNVAADEVAEGFRRALNAEQDSKKQARFMQAAAHDPKFAAKVGVPVKVAKEFAAADKAKRKGR